MRGLVQFPQCVDLRLRPEYKEVDEDEKSRLRVVVDFFC